MRRRSADTQQAPARLRLGLNRQTRRFGRESRGGSDRSAGQCCRWRRGELGSISLPCLPLALAVGRSLTHSLARSLSRPFARADTSAAQSVYNHRRTATDNNNNSNNNCNSNCKCNSNSSIFHPTPVQLAPDRLRQTQTQTKSPVGWLQFASALAARQTDWKIRPNTTRVAHLHDTPAIRPCAV